MPRVLELINLYTKVMLIYMLFLNILNNYIYKYKKEKIIIIDSMNKIGCFSEL